MGKHLVLAGGGHAHMVTLQNLPQITKRGHQVTVIGPSDFHYYSGMGPGMLGGTYKPEEIRFKTRHVVEKYGCKFIREYIKKIDPQKKVVMLESGKTVSYDAVSFNVGSRVPRDILIEEGAPVFPVKPIEQLHDAKQKVTGLLASSSEKNVILSVVGGGPAACEIAGNLFQLAKRHGMKEPVIRVFAGKKLMAHFPDIIRRSAYKTLSDRGIEIIEQKYVSEIKQTAVMTDSGEAWPSDIVFLAIGVKPTPIFRKSVIETGPDGGLLVNRFLQSPQYPEIFGGGDCIYFKEKPLDKVGVYAVRENPVLFHNLLAFLEDRPLMPFDPGEEYLLIFNMGGGIGILKKKWFFYQGKGAFLLKDFIDRRFMKKFQAIE
ncbi:MAG: FAD-dependent oxidoreductase [Proteobacteria bacterium]|nr:FAD-dependent oxidoreductase [Pseudomonadota bacterium]